MTESAVLDPVTKLSRDLKAAAATMTEDEARYMVDYYYQIQHDRIRAASQVRAALAEDGGEQQPHELLRWVAENTAVLETNIKRALDAYTDAHEVGRWSKSIVGIGPVIAAGLLAHVDITKAPTVGHIWRFAGLDPTMKWLGANLAREVFAEAEELSPDYASEGEDDVDPYALDASQYAELMLALDSEPERSQLSGRQLLVVSQLSGRKFGNLVRMARDKDGRITKASMLRLLARRPWNARLKTLCWKIGESFVKVSGREDDVYGQLYIQRKAIEVERNEAGLFADQAAASLAAKKFGADTLARKAYEAGKLPAARIHLRAQRWAVKIFLSHWHHVAYEAHYKTTPPKPYILTPQGGHAHEIVVPNWP